MQQSRSPAIDSIVGIAVDTLERYAAAESGSANACRHDAGPMVLANVADSVGALPEYLGRRVARRWLNELPETSEALGAFGGLGGFLAGVRGLIATYHEFSSLSDLLVEQTRRILRDVQWRTSSVAWADYDLFRGPAGLVLSGATNNGATAHLAPAARHLARLCEDPSLEGLRAGTEISPRSAFNVGRINTGLGHGVAGIASALRHAVEAFEDGHEYRPALRRACDWLVGEAYLADDDFITWPPVGRDGATPSGFAGRRQAWCYGTPGVAWTLWDAGRVLGDTSLQVLGEEAMRSFCRVFEPHYHFFDSYDRSDKDDISEQLSICHGAAGILAVADAFARNAGLSDAESLCEYLNEYLLDRVDQIANTARADMTILSGAGGILSVMLSMQGGARSWLCQIALR